MKPMYDSTATDSSGQGVLSDVKRARLKNAAKPGFDLKKRR
jgi:hypothetical protein